MFKKAAGGTAYVKKTLRCSGDVRFKSWRMGIKLTFLPLNSFLLSRVQIDRKSKTFG
jgi:hypothetical protein